MAWRLRLGADRAGQAELGWLTRGALASMSREPKRAIDVPVETGAGLSN